MKREWKPGDVALVDSWRGKRQIAFRCERIKDEPTWCVLDGTDTRGLYDHDVIAARPLVVIDPENREQVELLRDLMDAAYAQQSEGALDFPARLTGARGNAMQAALREFADPKPPKPEEPTGLGAVVEDAEGCLYVRTGVAGWEWCEAGGAPGSWSQIDAVRVLSPGVTA